MASIIIGSTIGLVILLNTTDPTKSIASILLVFLLLYLLFVGTIFSFISFVARMIQKRYHKQIITHERQYYTSIVIAFLPVSLLAMQSLHQIRILDLILASILMALILFYVYKRTPA